MRTRCLSIHAEYRCRHQGACCRADWTIEVDQKIVEALHSRRVVPLGDSVSPTAMFIPAPEGSAHTVARTNDGNCTFHVGNRCGLQNAGGESMLPSACRHFPRILLIDDHGCRLTLSHYCPTAAALLLEDVPVQIVDAHAPLALSDPLEGLDARGTLPPMLHPEMLMDLEGYVAWETAAVRVFSETENASVALATVAVATEEIRQWTPAAGVLAATVARAFADNPSAAPRLERSTGFDLALSLTGPHPHMAVPRDFEARWRALDAGGGPLLHRTVGRYMAAATFGNWMAYRGRGLRSVVEWLRACFDVLRVQLVRETAVTQGVVSREALIASVRHADYLVVHTVDSLAFGRAVSLVER